MSNFRSFKFIRALTLGTLLFFSLGSTAQVSPSPSFAQRADSRFQGVHEDWTSPALASSNLKPAGPLEFINEYPRYTVELLQLQWRSGDPIDLYVMKPKGVKKPPVILYLYGYPTDTDIFKREAYQELVTRDGFAAVGFVSALTGHRYHDRPMKQWFLSELQESLATSAHDVQMVLNYLATRDDLDMQRVGMFAQGSGASIAILASAVDPRIKVVETLDPWGDWPTWMATSPFVPEGERAEYVKPEFLKKVAGLDPVDWLPKMQAKKFRLDIELFDTNTPTAAREKLRAAVPSGATVMLYKNMEEFRAAFEDGKNLQWIRHELQSVSESSASSSSASRSASAQPHP
ncbi:MAG: alpha/beta hydrolase [Terriglobales bacterium]